MRRRCGSPRPRSGAAFALATALLAGCSGPPRNHEAIAGYEAYRFTDAREALRGDAYLRNDEQTILDNLRLGMASLADGDLDEAEATLGRVFDLLSTAGLNADRTTASVLLNEGVRIWKGEPFEQALAYQYVATLYAVKGDWENARAAASNALFRLADFEAVRAEQEGRGSTDDPEYVPVESDFTLGWLTRAIAADRSGAAGAGEAFDAALELRPDLEPLIAILRERRCDTLLVVDWGRGPRKVAEGTDGSIAAFVERDPRLPRLTALVDGQPVIETPEVCDVNEMAKTLRWRNIEDARKAKSAIGSVMTVGGTALMFGGGDSDTRAVGAGLLLAGALLKAGSRADDRHCEFVPAGVYLLPLRLREPREVVVRTSGGTALRLPYVVPGTEERPRAIYLRLFPGPGPEWLDAAALRYGNDHDGVAIGDRPWILGGTDCATPSRAVLEAYRAGGWLEGMTTDDLRALYEAEEILVGSGMETREDRRRNPSYRHVLEGGTGLFTPAPDSMGFKRLFYSSHPPYAPRSAVVRDVAARPRGAAPSDDLTSPPPSEPGENAP